MWIGGLLWFTILESENGQRMGSRVLLKLPTVYLRMTTFMLQGVSVRVKGSVCAPMLAVVGSAQAPVCDWS